MVRMTAAGWPDGRIDAPRDAPESTQNVTQVRPRLTRISHHGGADIPVCFGEGLKIRDASGECADSKPLLGKLLVRLDDRSDGLLGAVGGRFTVPDTVPCFAIAEMPVAVNPLARTLYKERETGLEPATSSLGS